MTRLVFLIVACALTVTGVIAAQGTAVWRADVQQQIYDSAKAQP